jgi:hypothetical protein
VNLDELYELLDDARAEIEIAQLLADRRKVSRAIEALQRVSSLAGDAVAELVKLRSKAIVERGQEQQDGVAAKRARAG